MESPVLWGELSFNRNYVVILKKIICRIIMLKNAYK